jgi:hypothetical protein
MAYWRIVFKGSLGTVEQWSTSVAFGVVGLSSDTPDQPAADDIAARIAANQTAALVPTSLRSLLSSSATMDVVRVEKRAEDETILTISERLLTVPLAGSGSASKTPQDAVVFSLRTNTPGARGRGRMYWPALAATLNSTFQLSGPVPATIVNDVKTWLQASNTAIDNYYISIASVLRAALSVRSITDHVCRDVSSIQVGSVLDTQRRRRDTLPESYVSAAYP